jgi:glycosyltransferase involved in cell wall biosynthesis
MSTVSVIIPAYNAEQYIEETVISVLNQSYQKFEIIIINDGSTDSTGKIIDELSKKDNRIIVQHRENSGVSASRNVGIDMSKGEYLAFLDADDYWLEDNLLIKVKALENNESDFVYSDRFDADENLNIISTATFKEKTISLDKILLGKENIIPSNLIISKKCIENHKIRFSLELSNLADQHFCALLAKNFKGTYISAPLLKYRILSSSMSRSLPLLEKDSLKAFELYSNEKLFKSYVFKLRCYSNMYFMLAGSWWVHGKNFRKLIQYISLSILYNPFKLFKLFRKLI